MANHVSFPYIGPFVMAVYCGDRKPSSVKSYTENFFNEFSQLKISGLNYDDK